MPAQFLLPIAFCSLILAACSRKEADSNPASAPGEAAAANQSSPASPGDPPATMMRYTYKESPQKITLPEGRQVPLVDESTIEPKVGEVIVTLTMHLRRFMQEKGHAPDSIGQLISSRMDSAPRPPAGTMYVIDARAKEVRLVKIK